MNNKIKTMTIIFLMVFVGLFGAVNSSAETENISEEEQNLFDHILFVPGEVLVGFNEEDFILKNPVDFLTNEYNGVSIESRETSYNTMVKVTPGSELSYCESVKNDPRISYAEPNYITFISKTPNDPSFSQQWGLDQDNDYDINAPEGWDLTTGNSNVKIAIIDTGVDYNHNDLAANCIEGYDFVDIDFTIYQAKGYKKDPGEDYRTRDDDPMDVNSHGSHCAGIASAVTDNGVGIAGVGWDCSIMPVRGGFSLLYEHGGVDYRVGALENADIEDAIDYAADNGADVISMSFGGSQPSSAVEAACNRAWGKGVVLVSSSGNEGRGSAGYPARYAKVIGVGSINKNGVRSEFSNYGAGLDIVAPGEQILSTVPGNSYAKYGGTSMACPHVAGVAGLAISKYPSYSNQHIRGLLENTANYIGPDLHYGRGLVDASFDEDEPPVQDEITVTITMDFIEALDKIDTLSKAGEWIYEIRVFDDYENPSSTQTQVRYNKEYESWFPFGWYETEKWEIEDGIHTFLAIPGQRYVDFSIRVYDWDGISLKDVADISACNNVDGDWSWAIQNLDGREYAARYYLDENRLSSKANPCEDIIEDGDHYLANGEIDGSEGEESIDKARADDVKVRYKIEDNYVKLHSPGLDAEGFHKAYFVDYPEWAEPNKDVEFTATVSGGAAPYNWEFHFGDGNSHSHQTNSREYSVKHKYLLTSDRRLDSTPSVEVTDNMGINVEKFYPTAKPGIAITNPPGKPDGGKTGLNKFFAETTDADGDDLCYIFEWDDGTESKEPSSGFISSGTRVEVNRKSSCTVYGVDDMELRDPD